MHILVLDTIHGGKAIGRAFSDRGDCVDCVDVYRKKSVIDVATACAGTYDLIVAPVHLDPDHPLLRFSDQTHRKRLFARGRYERLPSSSESPRRDLAPDDR